jgi:allantoate deiminase
MTPPPSTTPDDSGRRDPRVLDGIAERILERCDELAQCSEDPEALTRPCLSSSMAAANDKIRQWMLGIGMACHTDAIGNIIGRLAPKGSHTDRRLLIGSHLDTVVRAGRFDGALGVLLGLAVAELSTMRGQELPFALEVVGFCDEEGVRFRTPYLGSRALAGRFNSLLFDLEDDDGTPLRDAIDAFGGDSGQVNAARYLARDIVGYVEAHIEQGPVLDARGAAVGVVDAIVGQHRLSLRFEGMAAHAGTVPMAERRDALVAASRLVVEVNDLASRRDGLLATVGVVESEPNIRNVVPGSVRLLVDIRHAKDAARLDAAASVVRAAESIAQEGRVDLYLDREESDSAVAMDDGLTSLLESAVSACGQPVHRLSSGAGHDAVMMSHLTRTAMLFLRNPGGISHHPDESVVAEDIPIALGVLDELVTRIANAERRDSQSGVSADGAQ